MDYLYFILEGEFTLKYRLTYKSNKYNIFEEDSLLNKTQSKEINICKLTKNQIFGEEAFFKYPKSIFSVECSSMTGKLYRILLDDLKKRFWDPVSQNYLVSTIKPLFQWRRDRVEEIESY
jgi:hypothetical protein